MRDRRFNARWRVSEEEIKFQKFRLQNRSNRNFKNTHQGFRLSQFFGGFFRFTEKINFAKRLIWRLHSLHWLRASAYSFITCKFGRPLYGSPLIFFTKILNFEFGLKYRRPKVEKMAKYTQKRVSVPWNVLDLKIDKPFSQTKCSRRIINCSNQRFIRIFDTGSPGMWCSQSKRRFEIPIL